MIRFFASHPTAANILMLLLLAMGLMALPSIQRATFPDFTPTKVEVRVPYPGATASDVEEAVCRRIEDAVDGVENVKEIYAEARDNVGVVTLEMREGGSSTDFLNDIKTEVEAITEFPERAEAATIRSLLRTDKVVTVAITGDMADVDLKAYAEDVRTRLQRLADVSLVRLSGFGQRQLRIDVSAATLLKHGLSADDLARTISSQSIDLPAGAFTTTEQDMVVRFTDERRSAAELRELVVAGQAGAGEVRLGSIATIKDTFEPEEQRIEFDGKRAALLQVEKTKREDTLNVFDAVSKFVADERLRRPTGVSLAITQDGASVVRDRLDLLLRNGWQGLLLVFLVMWLFFGFRYSFWVAMGLPVSFLGALYVMPLLGMTINMLTMVALLMALGLLMDDAIVLAENIAKEVESGKGALVATVDGVRGVSTGVFSSFLTTVAVFAPLGFLSGDIGAVLRVVPIVLILVLAVSLIEAFLILPNHLAHFLAKQEGRGEGRFRKGFERGVDWIREKLVGRAVDWAVSWRYVTLGLVISAFLVSVGLMASGGVKFQAFPQLDGDSTQARLLLPAGTPFARTKENVARLVTALEQVDSEFTPRQPGNQPLVRHVTVKYNENADAKEQGAHVATIAVDLLQAEKRLGRLDDIQNRWREIVGPLPDVISLTFTQGSFGPAGRAIDVRVQGEDLKRLSDEAHAIRDYFATYDGVFNLMTDLRQGKPEAIIRMRPGARAMGFTASNVAIQLRALFHGSTASEIQVGSEDLEVNVRLAEDDRNQRDVLENLRVKLSDGTSVPLTSVATIEMDRGYARIARVNRRRTVSITGDIDTALTNTAQVVARFRSDMVPKVEARGVHVDLEGEIKEGRQTQLSMIRALLMGLIGVFFLLSFHFRSYLEPITVMMAIPLALIGVLWGHKFMGLPFTMPSMLGFASLAGVVVNDSILLVEFIRRRANEGVEIADAACGASRDRFRAILLTSLTTIVGLLPLLSETSLQAQILIPLAASIVFGMLASTVLVLIVIPCIYTILSDLGWLRKANVH